MEKGLMKKAAAEFLGTFVLVFVACGTAIVTGANFVATSLAFGLVIVAMAFSIGNISGCHINPAVSLGVLLCKKMSFKDFIVYVIAQILGATAGAAVLYGILKGMHIPFEDAIWATNGVGASPAAGQYIAGLAVELILTFIFVYVILVVTSKKENGRIAGFVIGLTLTLVHLIGIGFTGTSVNPARSIGPALMAAAFGGGTEALSQIWIFILAPLVGAALAALIFRCLHKPDAEPEPQETTAE